jgi:hypothetical protein
MADELNGGAPAPAEVTSTPAPDVTATETIEPSPRGAIDRAFAAMDVEAAAGDPETGTEPPAGQTRDPVTGKFVAKQPDAATAEPVGGVPEPKPVVAAPTALTTPSEPPARFSPDAKAAWATAPEAIKAETHRAIREMEAGIENYRTKYEPLKPYEDMAAKHGTDIKTALDSYTAIDTLLGKDLLGGLSQIAERYGTSLKDVAARVMGQKVEPNAQDQTIRALQAKITQLEGDVGSVKTTVQQSREAEAVKQVEAFAADKPHFEALWPDIVSKIKAGKQLPDAYNEALQERTSLAETLLADRLTPAAVPAAGAVTPAAPDRSAQTRKGQLSVTGAPGAGSNPVNRKPPSSAREALDNAFGAVGL